MLLQRLLRWVAAGLPHYLDPRKQSRPADFSTAIATA